MAFNTPSKYSPKNRKQTRLNRFLKSVQEFFFHQKRTKSSGMSIKSYGVLQRGSSKSFFTKYFSTFLVLVIGVVAFWGGYRVLSSSDVFRLNEIKITGHLFVSRGQILAVGGVELGMSLLQCEKGNIAAKITDLPWIERAEVIKQWPSTLIIKVREQKPLALVNVEISTGKNHLFYLNKKGKLFAPYSQGQDLDYPVLTGASWSLKDVDASLPKGELEDAALLLLKLAAKGNAILPIQSISEVHMSPKHGIVVYLVDRPFPIYIGSEGIFTKYYQLVKILERLYRKKQIDDIKAIRMDYSKNKILVARAEIDR